MKFTAKPVDRNGMSLTCYVEKVSMTKLLEKLPEGKMEGYFEPEKGYEEDELGFESETGETFYVYSRWNQVRIGSVNGFQTDAALELVKYLQQ